MNEEKRIQSADAVCGVLDSMPVYKIYLSLKAQISENAGLKAEIDEFKRLNSRLQMDKVNGREVSFDDERHAANVYWQIMLNETAREYLKAERELAQFLHGVFSDVRERAQLTVDFLV
ncbi:hypothetical protein FACS189490_12610 [Clostridia bacterium]|nr:hypothetical protein FACS189490_12610 [Clostridia bacterium]